MYTINVLGYRYRVSLLLGQVVVFLAVPKVLEATPTDAPDGGSGGTIPVEVDDGPIAIKGTGVLSTKETLHLHVHVEEQIKEIFLHTSWANNLLEVCI